MSKIKKRERIEACRHNKPHAILFIHNNYLLLVIHHPVDIAFLLIEHCSYTRNYILVINMQYDCSVMVINSKGEKKKNIYISNMNVKVLL